MMNLSKSARLSIKRQGHTLIVPYVHWPMTKFENGVPKVQVRQLQEIEKKWDFWTTSTAFYPNTPKTRGYVHVPVGEVWVVERLGSFNRVVTHGNHWILPFVESVKAVKVDTLCSMGVFGRGTDAKGEVDAYCVAYYKVVDPSASVYYRDAETNKPDSERSAALFAKKKLATLIQNGDQKTISKDLLTLLQQKQKEWGLEFYNVEVRGVFSADANVPAKVRAYEAPHPDFDAPGHDLAADYWQEHLTPGYFFKYTYGSTKRPMMTDAPSFEWSIPSPPDYHHFNQQPKVAVAPEIEELEKLGLKHH